MNTTKDHITGVALLVCALIGFSPAAMADWTVTIGNNIPGVLDAQICDMRSPEPPNDWPNALTGNTPSGLPVGDQQFYGQRLAGFYVGFCFGAPGAENRQDARELFANPVVLTLGRTAETAGYFPTTTIVFPGEVPPYISAQVRVWAPLVRVKSEPDGSST